MLVGRYELRDRIASGGMGTVWRATDRLLGRIVAVKQLTPGTPGRARDHLRTRAILEARALARVRHAAIVEIYDVIDADGDPWLVMEYIEGRSVTDIVAASGPQPVPAVARIGAAVADALQAVHAARILHRDVKPANILLTERQQVFLVDFGIAAIQDERTSLTGPHTVVGTAGFIAPERLRRGEVGPPSDTWSLGVTLYYALTARLPFSGPDPHADPETTLLRVLSDDPDPLDGPLSALVTAMLAKDPQSRPTLAQAATALRGTVSPGGSPRSREPPRNRRPPRDQGSTRKQEPTRKHEPPRNRESARGRSREPGLGEEVGREARRESGCSSGSGGDRPVESVPVRPSDAELAASVAGRPPREATRTLMAAPRDQAVRVLAAQRSATLAGLLPELAGQVGGAELIASLESKRLGRALGRMERASATAFTGVLPPAVAAAALLGTDPRTAKGPLSDLPESGAVRILQTMSATGAARALQYVHPVRIADLFRRMPQRRADAMLQRLPGPVRLPVQRELDRGDRRPENLEDR